MSEQRAGDIKDDLGGRISSLVLCLGALTIFGAVFAVPFMH